MKIPRLAELTEFNQGLRGRHFQIYTGLLLSVLQDHCDDSRFSPMIGYIRSKRWDLLYQHSDVLSAQSYSDANDHLLAHQIVSLIKKYPWKSRDVLLDPKGRAIETFMKTERRCGRINAKVTLLRSYRRPPYAELLLRKMKAFIRNVIGERPDRQQIYAECDFGPGASLGCHGDATSFGRKISILRHTVTPGALFDAEQAVYFHQQLRERFFEKRVLSNGWEVSCLDYEGFCNSFRSCLDIVQYNKVSFVPKTAKTHRSIAVEPSLNSFLQKGADTVIRRMLQRVGLDLRDQSENSVMACKGSLDCSDEGFCTIDLSNASDSISIELVREILPLDWFLLLNRWRSPAFRIDNGGEIRYQKFCSQGNGFNFPLQTLIFASIAHAMGCGTPGVDFRVYGDDIIVRKKNFDEVVKALRYLGFKTNMSKTYSEGPFRESCGTDWYKGEDVRPYTLDHRLDSLQNMFKFLNLSRRSPRTSAVLSPGFHYIYAMIPDKFRFVRPFPGNPDTGIDAIDYNFRYSKYARIRKGLNCYEWLELHVQPIEDCIKVPSWGVLASALRGHDSSMLFTFRRRTRTSMRFTAHSGATSMWLPASIH